LIAYLDTSAIMALLLRARPGHETAESVWLDADEVAAVHLAPVEVRAALMGERTGGRLRPSRFEGAKALWARMWQEMVVVLADEALVAAASDAAERHRLRGYDAIHLMAAAQSGCDIFVCSDVRLLDAARESGLTILNLNDVP
jgi:predicted nucleic acid-binding protein